MKNLYVIGNGESRSGIDLNKLDGKVYGCNAIYRDYTVDVLISVDPGIIHEIYHLGYAFKNDCYFRSWTPVPEWQYDTMLISMQTETSQNAPIKQNDKGDSDHFVIHASDVNKVKAVDNKNDIERWKGFGTKLICVSWVKEDRVTSLNDFFGEDPGWSAGAIALAIGVKNEKPDNVYMIGMDFYSKTDKMNNIYKDTDHYLSSKDPAVKPENWIGQFSKVFNYHPNVNFKWLTDGEILPEWTGHKNIEKISHNDLTIQ